MIDYTVKTKQLDSHPDLEKIVLKHANNIFQRPVLAAQQKIFDEINQKVIASNKPIILDSCCGTGMSTAILTERFPDHLVIGVDKSAYRLRKGDRSLLVRADVYDFWRLALQAKWNITHHFIFYPNPWPKPSHLKRRFYGHPILPVLLQLSPYLEVRSNWKLYLQEFEMAAKLIMPKCKVELLNYKATVPVSLFEKKYFENEQDVFLLALQH